MSGQVRYVRDITLAILETYTNSQIDVNLIQGIMINFDDRHFPKGSQSRHQFQHSNDPEQYWAACTKVFIFPNNVGGSKHLVGTKGSKIKQLKDVLDLQFPELQPWQFDVIRKPVIDTDKIEEIESELHIMQGNVIYKEVIPLKEEELAVLKDKQANFFGDFNKIRSDFLSSFE